MTPRQSTGLLLVLSGSLATCLIVAFYVSPLRSRIENKLYDIRVRLAPALTEPRQVGVVAIDDASISALVRDHTPRDRTPNDASPRTPSPTDLGFSSLGRIVEAALAVDPRLVAVLLPPQIFSYADPGLETLTDLARQDPRLLLGTFDLSVLKRGPEALPSPLRSVLPQVVKADIWRDFRREVVRDFRIHREGELPYLAYAVTTRLAPPLAEGLRETPERGIGRVKLHYFPMENIPRVRAESLLAGHGSEILRGRVVLIGYTTYRPWTLHANDATLVNSPWQADGEDPQAGIPVVDLQAIAIENVLEGLDLKTMGLGVNILQTVAITTLTLLIWRLGVGFASFLFLGIWALLLLAHAAIFAIPHLYVPLADTALASSLAMMSGALWRLRMEGRLRALHEAKLQSQLELAGIQGRFLDRFAVELADINRKVRALLDRHAATMPTSGSAALAFNRAVESSVELDHYLRGINQFASLPVGATGRPRLRPVDLRAVTERVLRQVETLRRERQIEIEVFTPGPYHGFGDAMLVGQILYNLVANAVKYSPAAGHITIRIEHQSGQALVRVRDHGPGISPELQERIFEKFYRVKDDHVYRIKGHGLGLYLSRYFAMQMNASISVSSVPGEGAEFTLSLRACKRVPS